MFQKPSIPLISTVLAIALLGLVGIQWYWASHALTLQEEAFDRKTQDALAGVVRSLEGREAYMVVQSSITNRVRQVSPQDAPLVESDTIRWNQLSELEAGHVVMIHKETVQEDGEETVEIKVEHRSPDGQVTLQESEEEILLPQGATSIPILNELELEGRKAFIEEIVHQVLTIRRPIEERASRPVLDSLLRYHLSQQGIEAPYSFELAKGRMEIGMLRAPEGGDFRIHLFPNDLPPSPYFLKLSFPDGKGTGWASLGLLLPTSGLLVLAVLVCFAVALIALQRQKRLSAMKSDFINNMTHELKTPIATIALAVEALQDPDMRNPERLDRYMGLIASENARLKRQVERVLQAAAFDQGEFGLQMRVLAAHELIAEQAGSIRLRAEQRGGQVHLDLAAQTDSVLADPLHLSGMILNLLDNAEKYSPDTPDIRVTTSNQGNALHIAVQDRGLGITREQQKHVFQQFYRVPTGNLHDVKGFGLGLSYVQRMAEAHGGQVHLQSQPGQGSTFTLILPLAPVTHGQE